MTPERRAALLVLDAESVHNWAHLHAADHRARADELDQLADACVRLGVELCSGPTYARLGDLALLVLGARRRLDRLAPTCADGGAT